MRTRYFAVAVAELPTPLTKKRCRLMACIFDLCKDVPKAVKQARATCVVMNRQKAALSKRVRHLGALNVSFEDCKEKRPNRRKSTAHVDTCGGYRLHDVRTSANSVVVCRSRQNV